MKRLLSRLYARQILVSWHRDRLRCVAEMAEVMAWAAAYLVVIVGLLLSGLWG